MIPLYDTSFEEAITFILERANSLAADKQPGEEFSVELEERLQGSASPVEIIGPVMMRAHEYGVCMKYVADWIFYFTREDSPSPA